MRNLLALVGAAVVAFAGVGWYLDWYHIKKEPPSHNGHQSVNIDVNGVKIGEDLHKGIQEGEEKLQTVLEKHPQDVGKHAEHVRKHVEKRHEDLDPQAPNE